MLDASDLLGVVAKEEEPDKDIIERLRFDDALDVPIEITDLDLWANYVNEDLYQMDKKIREFFKAIRSKRERKGGYRTTSSIVFAWMFGRKPTPADSATCRMLHRLLEYYCTSYTGRTTYGGKTVPRVYEFSRYATHRKRPYSLKLRLEEAKDGQDVWRNGPSKDKRRRGRRTDS